MQARVSARVHEKKEENRKREAEMDIREGSSDEEEEEEEEDGRNAGVNEAAGFRAERDVQDYRGLIKTCARGFGGRLRRGKVTQGNTALVIGGKARARFVARRAGEEKRVIEQY